MVLVETTIDLAIEGELFLRVREKVEAAETVDPTIERMPVYLVIFAIAQCVYELDRLSVLSC